MIKGILDYRTFYGKPVPADTFLKLEKYPTDVLISILSRINALIFQSADNLRAIDNGAFTLIFNNLDRSIYQRISAIRQTESGQNGVIFTPQPIVRLMGKLIAAYKPSTDTFMTDEDGIKQMMTELFDGILAANDAYYNDVNSENMLSKEPLWKLGLLQQDFVRTYQNMFGVIPIKIFMFYRFINERYGEEILNEFAAKFNVTTAYDFYFVFLGTIADCTNQFLSDRQPRFFIEDKKLKKVLEPFVFNPVHTKQSSAGEPFALINKPFYPLFDGIAVLDYTFFAHLTDISLIYHFYHSTSLRDKHNIKDYNEYLGVVGKYFYEECLTVQLMQKIFSHRYDKIHTEKDDALLPDILIMQNKSDVFVIEIKSVRAHGRVLEQADTSGFEKFLIDNFCKEKAISGEKNKGIYQLKRQIQHLKTKGKKMRVFPIIVYTEPSMDIPCVNTFLDEKFDVIIEEDRSFFKKIHPLTLINLDFFIKYFPSLKKQRYDLRDKIIEYHQKKKMQQKEALKTGNPFIYLVAEYSFLRKMEQIYPVGDPMNYFKLLSKELGFGREADSIRLINSVTA